MAAKITASSDGTKVLIGTAAEQALEIDSAAKEVKAVAPYTMAGNGPAFSARNSASQAVVASTWTKCNINTESFDTDNCFDTASARFTPTVPGYYLVNTTMRFGGTNMTGTATRIYKNGIALEQVTGFNNPASTRSETLSASSIIYMNGTTDYIEMWGVITGGTSLLLEFVDAQACCRFSAALVRAA